MIPDLKEKSILFIDWGNFIEVAMKLSESYGAVYYYCDWTTAYPKYDEYVIGDGINKIYPNFHHVESIWSVFDKIDLFYFPDLYSADFQVWLRQSGHLVFGPGKGENLELHRDKTKELMIDLGLPVNGYELVVGLSNLRERLKEETDVWVKTNIFRGCMESFHHEKYELSKPRLDRFEHTLGVFKERQEFVLEQPIEDSIDFAADEVVSDGRYPDYLLAGVERKNEAYLGVMVEYQKLPRGMKKINEALSSVLAEYKYRAMFSPESRVTKKGKTFLLDPCCRHGSPPTSLQIELWDNFAEVVWLVATGQKPVIKAKYKFGAQLIIKSEYSQKDPQALYFPEHIRPYVKIKNLCIEDGVWYYIPCDHESQEIGSVIGMGNTMLSAIRQCKENAELIEGDGVFIEMDSLDKAREDIKKLPEYGINVFEI